MTEYPYGPRDFNADALWALLSPAPHDKEARAMATYEIVHGPDDMDTVTADSVEYDPGDSMFYFKNDAGQTVAWAPQLGVRSIRLQQ